MTDTPKQHSDLEAEASVLGGILWRNDVLGKLADLEVEDFYSPKHQSVFSAMRNLESTGVPIDQVTLRAELVRQGRWESLGGDVGGQAFLLEIALRCPSPDNALHYAGIVTQHRVTRQLLEIIADSLYSLKCGDEGVPRGDDAVQWVSSRLGQIRPRSEQATVTVGEIVRERIRDYDRIAMERETGIRSMTGLPSGVARLDSVMGGYQRGIVTTLCGRPAMGKTSGGMAAADACSSAGYGVHVFSLEDPRAMYADRVVGRMGDLAVNTLRRAEFDRDEFDRMRSAVGRADKRTNWKVDDRSGLTAPEIVRAWRRAGEKNATQLVVVDLLQRIRKTDPRMKTYDHVTEVMHLLSDAAKADKIAVLLLAQLNREVERRDDKRPIMSDLQDAGTVEQDSKCIVGFYRGSYYYGQPKHGIDYEDGEPIPSRERFEQTVQLVILKDSNGATGRVFGRWHGPTTSLS